MARTRSKAFSSASTSTAPVCLLYRWGVSRVGGPQLTCIYTSVGILLIVRHTSVLSADIIRCIRCIRLRRREREHQCRSEAGPAGNHGNRRDGFPNEPVGPVAVKRKEEEEKKKREAREAGGDRFLRMRAMQSTSSQCLRRQQRHETEAQGERGWMGSWGA